MKTIEIKNICGDVIFSYTCENNTIKDTVEQAVLEGISLTRADLRKQDLDGANLQEADLS